MQTRRIIERSSVAERIAQGQAEKAQEAEANAALRAAIVYTVTGCAAAAQRNGRGGRAQRAEERRAAGHHITSTCSGPRSGTVCLGNGRKRGESSDAALCCGAPNHAHLQWAEKRGGVPG